MQFASAATVYSDSGQLGVIGIGLVHALVLTAIVYAIGYRSGAQVNPAVTIGLLVAKKIGRKEAVVYIIAQIIGAVLAAAVVYSIFGSEMSASVTLPSDGIHCKSPYLRNSNDIYIGICCIGHNHFKEL